MFPDFEEFLQCLNVEQAEYLVVGGYAVAHHAQPRATNDPDIFIGTDPDNAARVWQAMAKFGAALNNLTLPDFQDPATAFRMGVPPMMIEVIRAIDGVTFADAYRRRLEEIINPETGLTVPYISRADLLANKQAARRAKDLADVEAILEAAREQDQQPPRTHRGEDDGRSR
jgi:hypothetical protein